MENEVKIVEIKENLAERYAPYADNIRKRLKEKKTYLLNVMSSPEQAHSNTIGPILKLPHFATTPEHGLGDDTSEVI